MRTRRIFQINLISPAQDKRNIHKNNVGITLYIVIVMHVPAVKTLFLGKTTKHYCLDAIVFKMPISSAHAGRTDARIPFTCLGRKQQTAKCQCRAAAMDAPMTESILLLLLLLLLPPPPPPPPSQRPPPAYASVVTSNQSEGQGFPNVRYGIL